MIVKRLKPREDLKESLEKIRDENSLKSAIIICMVGSLQTAHLRMSSGDEKFFKGPLEIVSAQGTIASNGIHIHLAVADNHGTVWGGHLLSGCHVQTTIEVGLLEHQKPFKRIMDPETGYRELQL